MPGPESAQGLNPTISWGLDSFRLIGRGVQIERGGVEIERSEDLPGDPSRVLRSVVRVRVDLVAHPLRLGESLLLEHVTRTHPARDAGSDIRTEHMIIGHAEGAGRRCGT